MSSYQQLEPFVYRFCDWKDSCTKICLSYSLLEAGRRKSHWQNPAWRRRGCSTRLGAATLSSGGQKKLRTTERNPCSQRWRRGMRSGSSTPVCCWRRLKVWMSGCGSCRPVGHLSENGSGLWQEPCLFSAVLFILGSNRCFHLFDTEKLKDYRSAIANFEKALEKAKLVHSAAAQQAIIAVSGAEL